jgi:hypothetical protein
MVEQAFLPVHDAGQTGMSDPPNFIIHYGRSLMIIFSERSVNIIDYQLSYPLFSLFSG